MFFCRLLRWAVFDLFFLLLEPFSHMLGFRPFMYSSGWVHAHEMALTLEALLSITQTYRSLGPNLQAMWGRAWLSGRRQGAA